MGCLLQVAQAQVPPTENRERGVPTSPVPYSMPLPFDHSCLCRETFTRALKSCFLSIYCVALCEARVRSPWEKVSTKSCLRGAYIRVDNNTDESWDLVLSSLDDTEIEEQGRM